MVKIHLKNKKLNFLKNYQIGLGKYKRRPFKNGEGEIHFQLTSADTGLYGTYF